MKKTLIFNTAGLTALASIASAQVSLIDSDTLNLSSGTQSGSYESIDVKAGDIVIASLGTNKRIAGNGATSFTFDLNGSSGAQIGSITTLSTSAENETSAAWLFYTTVTTDGTATFDISASGNQSTPTYLSVLRATDSGNTLAIATDSFSVSGTGTGTSSSVSEDYDFTLAANAIAGSSNYTVSAFGLDLAGNSETNPSVASTIVGGSFSEGNTATTGDRGSLYAEDADSAQTKVTNSFTYAGLLDYDFNGIGAYVYAVPEPSTAGLIAGLIALGCAARRRRV